ncbi:hypothetical protein KIL84_021975 [Mauremys mutica]|uniref:Uncharacterized protein n=1 Tax=Mauremys mutica TaxID=74926 RepID=A0A9D3XGC1_9SAUR|nr:hypothetical protein KIL84_021975 [Mauremys mutica]
MRSDSSPVSVEYGSIFFENKGETDRRAGGKTISSVLHLWGLNGGTSPRSREILHAALEWNCIVAVRAGSRSPPPPITLTPTGGNGPCAVVLIMAGIASGDSRPALWEGNTGRSVMARRWEGDLETYKCPLVEKMPFPPPPTPQKIS